MKNKFALISVFFGTEPFWMPAFVLSCRYNTDIDWLFFTNLPKPEFCPNNLKYFHFSLDDFNRLSSNKLLLKVNISSNYTYKICDFRPAFGEIFEDYLVEYDFWGHCDIDVVWGDIKKYLTQIEMDKYDIVTSRVGRISGHFCLFRNESSVNSSYHWIPGIRKMLTDRKHYAIDEGCMTNYLQANRNPTILLKLKHAIFGKQKMVPNVFWEKNWTTSGAHQRLMGDDPCRYWWWKNGCTFDSDSNEVMYLHFHNIKKFMSQINFEHGDNPEKFFISKNGIFC